MEKPYGFEQKGSENLVCKLNKAIYELKQATKVWFDRLKSTLAKLGYNSSKSDNSLFTKFANNTVTYVLINVDDFIITGNGDSKISNLTKHMNWNSLSKTWGT